MDLVFQESYKLCLNSRANLRILLSEQLLVLGVGSLKYRS
jgi:hypothetical protein